MKRLIAILALLAACAAVGCASAKQDGSSFATAVIINVKHQAESPAAEWAWIEKNLPGARRPSAISPSKNTEEEVISFAHALHVHDGKTYSLILVVLADGSERTVYFDISNCFGK